MTRKKRTLSDNAVQDDLCLQEMDPPLGHALFRVMRALMFEETPIPELNALPLAQLRLLWTVFSVPNATMKDFSERLSVSQSTVTQLAERLVRRGLVERQTDAEDRRVVRLHVSETGLRLLSEAKARQRHTFHLVWNTLTSDECETVMRGLEVLGKAGETIRALQGRPLPACDPQHQSESDCLDAPEETSPAVVDLMARRVRGGAAT